MKVKSESEVAQLCPTLSDHMDCSLLGSSIHGIFQARVLEWGAIAFSGEASLGPCNYSRVGLGTSSIYDTTQHTSAEPSYCKKLIYFED